MTLAGQGWPHRQDGGPGHGSHGVKNHTFVSAWGFIPAFQDQINHVFTYREGYHMVSGTLRFNSVITVSETPWEIRLTWRAITGSAKPGKLPPPRKDGLCDEPRHILWIAADILPARRWGVFIHELGHALDCLHGKPKGKEARQERQVLLDRTVHPWEIAMGGRAKMEEWEPCDSPTLYRWRKESVIRPAPVEEAARELAVEPADGEKPAPVKVMADRWTAPQKEKLAQRPRHRPETWMGARSCPNQFCGRMVALPAIGNVKVNDRNFGPVLYRTIYCDCIRGLWSWFEPAVINLAGEWEPAPETGSLEPEPRKNIDKAEVEAWLKAHPGARVEE